MKLIFLIIKLHNFNKTTNVINKKQENIKMKLIY